MKSIFLAVFAFFIAFFVAGCSRTNSIIGLDPYISNTAQQPKTKSVNITEIKDLRENTMVVATINDNDGKLIEEVLFKTDLVAWFDKALKAELEARGVVIGNSDASASVEIKSLNAMIDGYSKQNMSAKCEVYITILNGGRTTTKRVAQNQSEFAVLRSARSLSPFVDSMMIDIVRKTADQIISAL